MGSNQPASNWDGIVYDDVDSVGSFSLYSDQSKSSVPRSKTITKSNNNTHIELDGVRQLRTYEVTNGSGSTSDWILLGTIPKMADAAKALFTFNSSAGYNGSDSQHGVTVLQLNRSWSGQTGTSVFVNGVAHVIGYNSGLAKFRLVEESNRDVHIYVNRTTFCNMSYTLQTYICDYVSKHVITQNAPGGTFEDVVPLKVMHVNNGGHNSEFDADMLDGFHSTDFIRSNSGTVTGNLNNYLVPGLYKVTDLNSLPNKPTKANGSNTINTGMLKVETFGDTNYVVQTFIGNGYMHIRTKWNGSWSTWYQVYSNGTDGSGSKLDADYLDGKTSSDFILSSNLSNSVTSTSSTQAASSYAVKLAYDKSSNAMTYSDYIDLESGKSRNKIYTNTSTWFFDESVQNGRTSFRDPVTIKTVTSDYYSSYTSKQITAGPQPATVIYNDSSILSQRVTVTLSSQDYSNDRSQVRILKNNAEVAKSGSFASGNILTYTTILAPNTNASFRVQGRITYGSGYDALKCNSVQYKIEYI